MNVAAIVIEKKVMKPTDWETHPSKHVRKAYPTFAWAFNTVREAIKMWKRENLGTCPNLNFPPPPSDNWDIFDFQNILKIADPPLPSDQFQHILIFLKKITV